MVNDLDPAVTFYTKHLGFQVGQQVTPNFAMLSRDNLDLVLSTPYGPGGAAKPMPDGRKAEAGGWNRLIISVDDLGTEVAKLREAHVHFRNDIVTVHIPEQSLPGFRYKPYHLFRCKVYHHSAANFTSYSGAYLTSYSAAKFTT